MNGSLSSPPGEPTADAACILCIENEVSLLADVEQELMAAGYRVLTATSASQALEYLQHQHPALVLCDLMLGEGDEQDGYFVHRHMRERCPELADSPFILLTTLGHRDALLRAKREGVDDCLVKPVDYDLLLATIDARLTQVSRLRRGGGEGDDFLRRICAVFDPLPGAVLLSDSEGRLLYANAQAERLAGHDLWAQGEQRQILWPLAEPASSRLLQRSLRELAESAEPAGRTLVLEQRGGSALLVSLSCLEQPVAGHAGRVFALYLCSAHSRSLPSREALRLMFGLTPSEASVALLLARGQRKDEMAEALAVSATTVAFHLRNLFVKVGVTRQTDLVARILAVGWAVPDPCWLDDATPQVRAAG